LRYLDTGAMYRALTWWLLAHRVDVNSPALVAASATRPAIEVGTDPDDPFTTVDGADVSSQIRERLVSNAVSAVASVPAVRIHLIARQREIIAKACAEAGGIVAEGRDIGTVVAPDAAVKVFLTASETARARRRAADLSTDPAATIDLTRAEQARRDRLDAAQSERADDAVPIDSTQLGVTEVIAEIVALAQARWPAEGSAWTA
jgi:cytidylate kinase